MTHDALIAGGSAPERRGFGSDNQSGVHPAVFEALAAANVGHVDAYGDDPITQGAEALIADIFGAPCTVAVVVNGTGANVVGLAAALDPWSSIVASTDSHINTDECGALEAVIGAKIVSIPTPDGKLTPEMIVPYVSGHSDEHRREPKVVSISNLTELGTVYTVEEVRLLADFAHERGMLLHVDGARIANAAMSLGASIADLTGKAGVDVFSFGGTKNGMMGAEAVVLGERVDASRIRYHRKQNLQLASKQRFLSAQFLAMYAPTAALPPAYRCAEHANSMAARLVEGALSAGVRLQYEVGGNEIFAVLPKDVVSPLADRFRFYTWVEDFEPGYSSVRWVTSWDTTQEDVDELVAALADALGRERQEGR